MGMIQNIEDIPLSQVLAEAKKLERSLAKPEPKSAPVLSEADHKQILAAYKNRIEEIDKVHSDFRKSTLRFDNLVKDYSGTVSSTIRQSVEAFLTPEMRDVKYTLKEISEASKSEKAEREAMRESIFVMIGRLSIINIVLSVIFSLTTSFIVAKCSKSEEVKPPVLSQELIEKGNNDLANLITATQKDHAEEVKKASNIHVVLPAKGE